MPEGSLCCLQQGAHKTVRPRAGTASPRLPQARALSRAPRRPAVPSPAHPRRSPPAARNRASGPRGRVPGPGDRVAGIQRKSRRGRGCSAGSVVRDGGRAAMAGQDPVTETVEIVTCAFDVIKAALALRRKPEPQASLLATSRPRAPLQWSGQVADTGRLRAGHQSSERVGGRPHSVAGRLQAVAGRPQAVAGRPQAVAGQPQAVAGRPQAVAGGPHQNAAEASPSRGHMHRGEDAGKSWRGERKDCRGTCGPDRLMNSADALVLTDNPTLSWIAGSFSRFYGLQILQDTCIVSSEGICIIFDTGCCLLFSRRRKLLLPRRETLLPRRETLLPRRETLLPRSLRTYNGRIGLLP